MGDVAAASIRQGYDRDGIAEYHLVAIVAGQHGCEVCLAETDELPSAQDPARVQGCRLEWPSVESRQRTVQPRQRHRLECLHCDAAELDVRHRLPGSVLPLEYPDPDEARPAKRVEEVLLLHGSAVAARPQVRIPP